MANYTFLNITAFGSQEALLNFDSNPPKLGELKLEINANLNSRQILVGFESRWTSEILDQLNIQIKTLSLLVDAEIEAGYAGLLFRRGNEETFKILFEIPDFRDDEFFTNFNSDYFDNFDKVKLTKRIVDVMDKTTTGKVYLNLLSNPKYYINI